METDIKENEDGTWNVIVTYGSTRVIFECLEYEAADHLQYQINMYAISISTKEV